MMLLETHSAQMTITNEAPVASVMGAHGLYLVGIDNGF